MNYKFEIHAHTLEGSPCAEVCAKDLIQNYHKNGYSGIIITDHISRWSAGLPDGSWEERIKQIESGWSLAHKEGLKYGINVLLGFEITLDSTGRDFLVYSDDYNFLYENENIFSLDLKSLYALSEIHNFIIISAHPFRNHSNPPDERYIHGAEIYNGNRRHENDNHLAQEWISKTNLIALSGSDFHESGDISSGITLDCVPQTITEFINIIKKNEYHLN